MKYLYHFLLLLSCFSIMAQNEIQTKRIIFVLFPGGNKQHDSIKELIEYSINNNNEYAFEYHIVIYKNDLPLWEQFNTKDYQLYSYGSGHENVNDFDNITGVSFITHYIKWLSDFSKMFFESNIMKKLNAAQGKKPFDLIATDIPNYVSVLIQNEFNIPLKLYLSPRPLPQLLSDLFELNTNYVPAIGSEYSNKMDFIERLNNFFAIARDKYIHWRMYNEQALLFQNYNYTLKSSMFMRDALTIVQYPHGLMYPMSTPPNFVFLNAIIITPGKELTNKDLHNFVNKHKRIVYFTEEAFKSINITDLIDISKREDIGIVVQSNKANTLSDASLYKTDHDLRDIIALEENMCVFSLGDINTVSQALYSHKPVILLNKGIMQKNVISMAVQRKIGLKLDISELSKDNIHQAITTVCLKTNSEYKANAILIGRILHGNKNAKSEYVSWLNYGFSHSYQTLIVPLYLKGNWFNINCLDVSFFFLAIILLIILILRFITNKMFGTCTKDKKRPKTKKE